jgi:N utilization substance protein A
MAVKTKAKTQAEHSSEMLEALKHVSDEKGIPVEALVASIEGALVSAYKKAFGGTGAVRIQANFETSEFDVYAQKRVVQRAMNPNVEIAWREAREQDPGINLGDTIETKVTPAGFGRIAALTAKQVLLQKLKEAERDQVVSEYRDKEGQMFRGVVQRIEHGNVILSIGKAEAVLPRREQVQGEGYRFGDQIYVYVTDVRHSFRGPSISVSRTHPGLVRQLFTREVPEIAEGIVELKNVSREAGQRTKIAVAAENPDVDPVGACVGPRGMRVGKVVGELGNEKVDIVRWHSDPVTYISNALSPAQISKVILREDKEKDGNSNGTATVIVTEDQQSLAIGKQGQNVRLAARLTGWRIDIRTEKQYATEQADKLFRDEDHIEPDASVKTVTVETDPLATLFAPESVEDENVVTDEAASTPEASAVDAREETESAPEANAAEVEATEASATEEPATEENAAGA